MNEEWSSAESAEPAVDGGAVGESPAAASERTGVPAVDRVLAEVESVGTLPIAERVRVFERVHEELRRSLDANPTRDVAGR
ncbi:hypothetical protein [Nocardioides daphniae]|uniref:Uncharacterized protein n=1 Tax=Nocardioides daphniae TaxID=402297 RepID=A0A4P7UB38_9ACTN|nr:hypothetical protein [Nocardioides daphniae]QCC77166.1 hypothetical protein E2C04_07995 [Nocardioides daphniae]GGD27237.1 hypothetical protein GCM10007231_28350 [Nocardioides daphniae]